MAKLTFCQVPVRGWILSVSCFLVGFVTLGAVHSFGLLFPALVYRFGIGRQEASWPFTASGVAVIFVAPLTGFLSNRFSTRAITMTALLLFAVGNSACFFSPNLYYIIFFFGIIKGSGQSMGTSLIPGLINTNIQRHRATIMGFVTSGPQAAAFVVPQMTQYFLDEYGLEGTFLLLGGMALQGLIGAMFLVPISTRNKSEVNNIVNKSTQEVLQISPKPGNIEEQKKVLAINSQGKGLNASAPLLSGNIAADSLDANQDEHGHVGVHNGNQILGEPVHQNGSTFHGGVKNAHSLNHVLTTQINITYKPRIAREDSSKFRHDDEQGCIDSSIGSAQASDPLMPEKILSFKELSNDHTRELRQSGSKQEFVEIVKTRRDPKNKLTKSSMFNQTAVRHILTSKVFYLITASDVVLLYIMMTFSLLNVDYLLDKGIEIHRSLFMLTGFGVGQVTARLSLGWITDRKYVTRPTFIASSTGLLAIFFFSIPYTFDLAVLLVLAGLLGLVHGAVLPVTIIVLSDYLPNSELDMAYSFGRSIRGASILLHSPLIGFFRDGLGSYDNMLRFVGGLSLLTSLAWAWEAVQQRQESARKSQEIALAM